VAPLPVGMPQTPQSQPTSHMGDVLDMFFTKGSFAKARQMEQAQQDAENQRQQLAVFAASLPNDDMRKAFYADPAGFLSHWQPNLGPQDVAGGHSVLGPGIGGIAAERTAPEMSVQNGTPITHRPGSVSVDGQRLPGDISVADGVIIDNHGGPVGTVGKPITNAQTGGISEFTPSINYRPPQMPQAPGTAPAAPAGAPPAGSFAPPPPPIPQANNPPPPPAPPNTTPDPVAAIRADPQGFLSGVIGRPVIVTSGQRSAAHNAAVHGSSTSEHLTNSAWDIQVPGMTTTEVAQRLAASGLPFDQVIDEGSHTHIGFGPKDRGAVLQGNRQAGYRPLGTRVPMPQAGGAPPAPGPVVAGPVTAADGSISSQGGVRQLTPGTPREQWRQINATQQQNTVTGEIKATGGSPQAPGRLGQVALRTQDEHLESIRAASAINTQFDHIERQLDSGQLRLGPWENFGAGVENAVGMSDQNARNYASFRATLERARNDSLRLNKGVQTEGDAQRAWNELVSNINDPKVVRQRLEEIKRYNEMAIAFHQDVIDQMRSDAGLPPIDVSRFRIHPPGQAPAAPATPAPAASGQGWRVIQVH